MRGREVLCFIICFLLGPFFDTGSVLTQEMDSGIGQNKDVNNNPIANVPLINFTLPFSSETPLSTQSSDPALGPTTTTFPTTSPSPSESWCVASPSASKTALQVALDYACGRGGVDCSAIQPAGPCYEPTTVEGHASYAFNSYYRKNPGPASCNFAGTAVATNTDPSSGKCHYPSTSTSSSILNTTNQSGFLIFGSEPSSPYTSTAAASYGLQRAFLLIFLVTWQLGWRESKKLLHFNWICIF